VGVTFCFTRHGQTEANARGLLLGRQDPDLDEVGGAQAQRLAAALPAPSLVVSSPLGRARQTAAAFGAPVEVDDRWIELDYGEWDGRPTAEVAAEDWRRWQSDPGFTPPGGESLATLFERVADACEDLVARDLDGDVVVVSHVSPVKAALGWALGMGPEVAWRTYVAPASITRVGLGPTGPSLRSFNEVAHLA
jgi:broad specificity phosphatase PhoE